MTSPAHSRKAYLNELARGPQTTSEIADAFSITTEAVATMMRKLRKARLVKSSKVFGVHGNIRRHEIIEAER